VSRLSPSMELLRMGRDFVQTATAKFGPSLGQQTPAHRSGRAIEALQDQSVQASSNYLDNLVQITMPYEAMVVLDLIPEIYDRPGRVATILDENEKPSQVMLNAPFAPGPNGRPMTATPEQVADTNHPAKHFDLSKGRYGVSITVGKKSASRLQAGADAIGAIIEADPQMLPLVGPEWMRFQDFPGKDALEKVLRKQRDHQFPWLSDAPDAQMPQQLAQAQQQIQMLTQQLQQASELADKNRTTLEVTRMKEMAESDRAAKDREVKLAVAELGAKVDRMALFLEERARVGSQQHEASMAAMEHANTLQQNDQMHGQALAQSDQEHNESLDAAAQQQAMAPPPQETDTAGV